MSDLVVIVTGMALIGYGERGEAWLVDTDKVPAGHHKHQHSIKIGEVAVATLALKDGALVTFEEENGELLSGAIDLAPVNHNLVDLNAVLDPGVTLDPTLAVEPTPGGAWNSLLAAWVRLPGGEAAVSANAVDTWPFARGGSRTLSEELVLTRSNVTRPFVRVSHGDGSVSRIEIPSIGGTFRVVISTLFRSGATPPATPAIGSLFKLDEIVLLYGCMIQPSPLDVPERAFTAADAERASLTASIDLSVCPIGSIHL